MQRERILLIVRAAYHVHTHVQRTLYTPRHSCECVMCARCNILTPPFVPTLRIRDFDCVLFYLFLLRLLLLARSIDRIESPFGWCVCLAGFTIECFVSPNMIGSRSSLLLRRIVVVVVAFEFLQLLSTLCSTSSFSRPRMAR